MATKYCECGEQLFVDFRWNGFVSVPRIHTESDGRAKEVTHCPGCGEWLAYDDLTDSAPPNVEVTGLAAASLPQGPCGLPGSATGSAED